jgi:hypothetical protein
MNSKKSNLLERGVDMKKMMIVLTLTNLLLCSVTFAGFWKITQLTDNTADDRYPCISGTNVVWEGHDGHDWEIYSNFAGQLTDNNTDDNSPYISGTNVVWCGSDGHDLEIYSNFAGQLSNNSTYDHDPKISGTNVVWYGGDGQGDAEIYSNFAGQLTNNSTDDWDPAISGTNVVWFGWDGHDREIYSNFAGQLTNNNSPDRYPSISGTNVVWDGGADDDGEIFSNFSGQITNNTVSDQVPCISGTNVVWWGWDGHDWEIFSNFGGQISDNGFGDFVPRIDGTNVVWFGWDGSDYEIYMATYHDADGDGIEDSIDTAPGVYSDAFVDGPTDGFIADRGEQTVIITDALDPLGVRIKASTSGGATPAQVSICGAAVVTLNAGDEVIVTHSSVDIAVVDGTVQIIFAGTYGTQLETNLNEGNSIVFEPETCDVTAPSTNVDDVIIFVDGQQYTRTPGETGSLATPEARLARLAQFIMDEVAYGNIASELEVSLCAKVDAALSALQRDNPNAAKVAMNDLKALTNHVEAQIDKKITPEAAAEIIQQANTIIAALGG